MVDFFSKFLNKFTRSINNAFILLISITLFKDGLYPLFQSNIAIRGNKEITCPIDSIFPEFPIIGLKLSHIEGTHTLDKIFFDGPRCCHNAIHHFVFHQISYYFTDSTWNHIWSVPQKYCAPLVFSILHILLFNLVLFWVDCLIR